MKKKTNKSSPVITRLTTDMANPSLTEISISLIDYNGETKNYQSTYIEDFDDYNSDYSVIYDEKVEKDLTSFSDFHEYVKDLTVKTVGFVKKVLKSLKKYEILAFNIPNTDSDANDTITFFIKTIGTDKFTILSLSYDYEIDLQLFMNSLLNLGEFRYYGSGLYGFYMKDSLIEYEFELLKYNDLPFKPKEFINIESDPDKKDKGIYFVIKNSLNDPVILTHLFSDEIETFNKSLTKADPQVGLLFSLSYNANK